MLHVKCEDCEGIFRVVNPAIRRVDPPIPNAKPFYLHVPCCDNTDGRGGRTELFVDTDAEGEFVRVLWRTARGGAIQAMEQLLGAIVTIDGKDYVSADYIRQALKETLAFSCTPARVDG